MQAAAAAAEDDAADDDEEEDVGENVLVAERTVDRQILDAILEAGVVPESPGQLQPYPVVWWPTASGLRHCSSCQVLCARVSKQITVPSHGFPSVIHRIDALPPAVVCTNPLHTFDMLQVQRASRRWTCSGASTCRPRSTPSVCAHSLMPPASR